MIVVSDTSVLTYLIQIKQLRLLENLFEVVYIPPSVEVELFQVPGQAEILNKAKWIKVEKVKAHEIYLSLIQKLDKGEAEAIALAIQKKADVLLIDEKKGREIAKSLGLEITGLLGIFIRAKKSGLILNLKPILDELTSKTGFWISKKLYLRILEIVEEG